VTDPLTVLEHASHDLSAIAELLVTACFSLSCSTPNNCRYCHCSLRCQPTTTVQVCDSNEQRWNIY